jgi:type II secretory pathway pseudopilin PulG
MKKKRIFAIALLVVALVATLAVPAFAKQSEHAEGLWQYQPFIDEVRLADGNTFLKTHENGKWTGTFSGKSTEDGKVVIHSSGAWSFKGTVSFEGVVNGKTGTLTMLAVGSRPDENTDWTGKWVILSGTGDLANLRGQGTWSGPGAPAPEQWGDIYYAGDIHFEP